MTKNNHVLLGYNQTFSAVELTQVTFEDIKECGAAVDELIKPSILDEMHKSCVCRTKS